MQHCGLFVGLMTLDFIYLVRQFPQPNEKIVASDYLSSAGGPATNAAIAFAALGKSARVLGVLGKHPNAGIIRDDLQQHRVQLSDLEDDRSESPPVSSVIVTEGTGDRAVISLNAVKSRATPDRIPPSILAGVDVVLIDGHQMDVGEAIAKEANTRGIPVVIDGGSWKEGFDCVLPFVDYAICSANFYPPACQTAEEVFAYLAAFSIPHIAITNGEKAIRYWSDRDRGSISIPSVKVVDTLGAGDIFHGAFCHYICTVDFIEALASAAKIATRACQFFGTRAWIGDR
ncbi:MAG: sugar kinase [Cyanobacteria bacterium SBLK]|nr:sugar kinase [Cyanobacteria bacterium SBLK]